MHVSVILDKYIIWTMLCMEQWKIKNAEDMRANDFNDLPKKLRHTFQ